MVGLPKVSTGALVGGAAIGASVVGLGVGAAIASHHKRHRKRKTHRSKNSRKTLHRGKKRKLKFGSKAYRAKYLKHGRRRHHTPHTAGKRKDTSKRRIRYTKNNQPYIIMGNGRARFISKRSVSSSRKRQGGKY